MGGKHLAVPYSPIPQESQLLQTLSGRRRPPSAEPLEEEQLPPGALLVQTLNPKPLNLAGERKLKFIEHALSHTLKPQLKTLHPQP